MTAWQVKLKMKQYPLLILKGEEEVNPTPPTPGRAGGTVLLSVVCFDEIYLTPLAWLRSITG